MDEMGLVEKTLFVGKLRERWNGVHLVVIYDAVEAEDVAEYFWREANVFLKFLFQVAFAHAKLFQQVPDFYYTPVLHHDADTFFY